MSIDLEYPTKKSPNRKLLISEQKEQLVTFLKAHKENFTWTHQNMLGIDTSVIVHKLNVDPKALSGKQKRCAFNSERYARIN